MYLHPPERLDELLDDEPPYRARQLRDWLYRTPVRTTDEMTNLPAPLRARLADRHWPFSVDTELVTPEGDTRKWLLRAPDGATIETVLMGYRGRTTICVSTQVGCAMGCTFCATGQFGFERHLAAGEIVAQVAWANAVLGADPLPGAPPRVTNVVFMGMGEPLANYDEVREAIRRLVELVGMSARSITVSTVGIVPGIRQLAAEPWPVTLAISLHAVDDETRSEIVPINRRYPIDDLVAAGREYFDRTGRRVSLEWTLIAGTNDTPETARRLAGIARRMRAHVNVIPLNPTPRSSSRPPDRATIDRFVAVLRRAGVRATLRATRGRGIEAACGQLRVRRSEEPLTLDGPVA